MIGLQFVDVVGLTMLVRFDRRMPEIVCTNFIFQIRTHSYLRISVSDFIGKAIKPSLELIPLRLWCRQRSMTATAQNYR